VGLGHDVTVTGMKNKPGKFEQVLARIRSVRGLDEHERILFARSLAATPDRRWQIHNQTLRSLILSSPSVRKRFGF
jgi:hypothetical protein